MNAIDLLTRQHREVEALFERYRHVGRDSPKAREAIFEMIADALAIHTQLEEKIFYPAAKFSLTKPLLRHSVEEHLEAKRLIAELLEAKPDEGSFDSKVEALEKSISHHVQEEESQLMPLVQRQLGSRKLDLLGEEMERLASELEEEEPRNAVPSQTDQPALI